MNRLSTAVDDVRSSRKRFSISGSLLPLLLLLLVMLVTQTSARPQTAANETTTTETHVQHNSGNSNLASVQKSSDDTSFDADDSAADMAPFNAGDGYEDIDNVEIHHVKLIDGIMHEDHPIIMYKEDFVSEDYDPSQHTPNTSANSEMVAHPRRKYKNIKRQHRQNRTEALTSGSMNSSPNQAAEKYHALKPEKIYFDILPQSPVVLTDDSSSNDSKFDAARIHVEVIPLLDDDNDDVVEQNNVPEHQQQEQQSPSKELLNKHPKKYHHRRLRRDLEAVSEAAVEHKLHKRTPHYTYERNGPNSFDDFAKHLMNNHWVQKHPVAGNRWNGIDGDVPPIEPIISFEDRFGGEYNTDRVVWGISKAGSRPATTRPTYRPATTKSPVQPPNFPPLFHNSNPGDADFSAFTTRRPQNTFNNNNNNNNNRRPMPTKRPAQPVQPKFPPLFHDSNPDNADFSVFTRPPRTTTTTTTRRPPPPVSNSISTGGNNNGGTTSISQCVWAIVNCCATTNTNIRYSCFERLGCRGAFWDLNPCAENVKDSVLDYIDQQLE